MRINNEIEIVLVEDSQDDAELTMRSLRRSDLVNEIVWLKDGAEVMDFLLGESVYDGRDTTILPKLILLDLKLPKMNGIEVLERIKSNARLKNIPVVVMTSSNENKDLEKCYELGVNSYVVKPIRFSDFMKVAKEVSTYWLSVNKTPGIRDYAMMEDEAIMSN